MPRSLLLLASGCYIHVDELTKEGPDPVEDVMAPDLPDPHEEFVYQEAHEVTDVLFVVQNDPDADGQQTFLDHMPLILDFLGSSGADWHMGFVSSGLDDPSTAGVLLEVGGQGWLDPEIADPMGQLAWADEDLLSRPRDAAYEALQVQGPLANDGFLRASNPLAVVVVSDGEDASTISEAQLGEWLASFGGSYSCLLTGPGTACQPLNGGLVADVADVRAYEELGLLVTGLVREFFLSALPVVDTIEVRTEIQSGAVLDFEPVELDDEGNVVSGDWIYDPVRNSIRFLEYVPGDGEAVRLRYELAP